MGVCFLSFFHIKVVKTTDYRRSAIFLHVPGTVLLTRWSVITTAAIMLGLVIVMSLAACLAFCLSRESNTCITKYCTHIFKEKS